jgi:hypothetical protein
MTMPHERTRALRWAGEFLQEVLSLGELSEARRREVIAILRHYPTSREIEHRARCGDNSTIGPPWLGQEET